MGAHKTATTYLQARFARSVSPLLEKSVFFVPMVELRKKIVHVRNINNPLNILPGVRNWRTAQIYRKYLQEAEIAKCKRLVFSEENLLGSLTHVAQLGHLYPTVNERLSPVFKGLNGSPVTALLAVRSYDSFLAAIWSQFIRKKGYHKLDEQTKARLLTTSRGWVEVIDDIIRILPAGSQLRVWRYEEFSKLQKEIICLFVGEANVGHVEEINENLLPSLTEQAMKQLETLDSKGMPTGRADVKRVGKKYSKNKGFKTYSPWTDEERAVLAKRYDDDIAQIQKRWPNLIISSPADACHS